MQIAHGGSFAVFFGVMCALRDSMDVKRMLHDVHSYRGRACRDVTSVSRDSGPPSMKIPGG